MKQQNLNQEKNIHLIDCSFVLVFQSTTFSRTLLTHHQAGHSNATEFWTNIIPHSYAPSTDPLANRQLQEEEWDANKDKKDEVWNKVGTCEKR